MAATDLRHKAGITRGGATAPSQNGVGQKWPTPAEKHAVRQLRRPGIGSHPLGVAAPRTFASSARSPSAATAAAQERNEQMSNTEAAKTLAKIKLSFLALWCVTALGGYILVVADVPVAAYMTIGFLFPAIVLASIGVGTLYAEARSELAAAERARDEKPEA